MNWLWRIVVLMSDADHLGGRLRLLDPEQMTAGQRTLLERVAATRGERGRDAGYTVALADGRLVGPFNALIRVPEIAGPQLAWAEAVSRAPLSAEVREVAILAVAAAWGVDYVRYAHERAARAAGVPETAITAIRSRREPPDVSTDAELAYRLTVALVEDHDVPDQLHDGVLTAMGEASTVALLCLIGQYLTTSVVLTCFRVPAPGS